jgi:hypothetical protein
MQKSLYRIMLLLMAIAVITASAVSTTMVFADDGVPTDEPAAPAAGDDQPVVDETLPTEGGEALPEEQAPSGTVEAILEQIPEGTDLVVLGEQGVEPLATEAAAQIIIAGDPIWCPAANLAPTANANGCTGSHASFADLLAQLQGGGFSGPGIIWVEGSYDGVDDSPILFDGEELTTLGDLEVRGGWSGVDGSGAVDNGDPAELDVSLSIINWVGDITVRNIFIEAPGDTGLFIETSGDITLTNTSAADNGFDGADLINYGGGGNVTVTGGNFSGNDEAGLYILSAGNVVVSGATVGGNRNGAIIDTTDGSGTIQVTNSTFNGNTWTGIDARSANSITLTNVTASGNSEVGAYLDALGGSGSVFINTSTFNSNGDWGIKAFARDGSIEAAGITENGGGITQNGAWLKSYNGDVVVNGGTFTGNLGTGLLAVAGGGIELTNVDASGNGGEGVEAYSIYNFACFGTKDIVVDVDGGTYTPNGGYGLYAEPGAAGSVNLSGVPAFAPSGPGSLFVSNSVNPCPPAKPGKPENTKPSKIVEVPDFGGDPVLQDCEIFSSTTLKLDSGTSVKVGCPFSGSSNLADMPEDQLPGELPSSLSFASAVAVGLDDEEGNPVPFMDEGGLLTLSFVIPEELLGKRLSIVYWDPTANDGQGDWIELPLDQFGGQSFPLHPDDPDDGRKICSGLERSGDTVSVTVNFPGVFALVAR